MREYKSELTEEIIHYLQTKETEIRNKTSRRERYLLCADLLKSKYVKSLSEIAHIDDIERCIILTKAAQLVPYIVDFITTSNMIVLKEYYNDAIVIMKYINSICDERNNIR